MSSSVIGRRMGDVLLCAGCAVAVIGVLGVVAGLSDGPAWILVILGAVALIGGGYVALVGRGLSRRVDALRRQRAELAIDRESVALVGAAPAEVFADCDRAAADGRACASCDSTCALAGLRQ